MLYRGVLMYVGSQESKMTTLTSQYLAPYVLSNSGSPRTYAINCHSEHSRMPSN